MSSEDPLDKDMCEYEVEALANMVKGMTDDEKILSFKILLNEKVIQRVFPNISVIS